MAVAFDTSTNGFARTAVTDGSSNTTLTVNVPSNVVNGNLLIAIIHNNTTANPGGITQPSGWTQIFNSSATNGLFTVHTYIGWRIASSEPASYAWTINSTNADDQGWIFRVTGHDATTPIDIVGTANPDSVLNPVASSITTASANALAVWVCGGRNGNNLAANDTNVAPSQATQIAFKKTQTLSTGMGACVAYELRATAGATGTRTFTGFYPSASQYAGPLGFAIKEGAASGLTITSVTPSSFDSGIAGIVIAGSGFGASQGASTVDIGGQAQTVTAWSDTSITFTSVRGNQATGSATLAVDDGTNSDTSAVSWNTWRIRPATIIKSQRATMSGS